MLVPKNINKVIVSNHAAIRVVQRLKLFMTVMEQANPKLFVTEQFRKGCPDRRWETSPFISNQRNKQFRVESDLLDMRGRYCENGDVVITTVIAKTRKIKEILNEKSR